jgi:hypothetical protein
MLKYDKVYSCFTAGLHVVEKIISQYQVSPSMDCKITVTFYSIAGFFPGNIETLFDQPPSFLDTGSNVTM